MAAALLNAKRLSLQAITLLKNCTYFNLNKRKGKMRIIRILPFFYILGSRLMMHYSSWKTDNSSSMAALIFSTHSSVVAANTRLPFTNA